ncbi:MAG TPA: hypothetical protein VFV07_00875 [Rhizomicrobium sp.]|nr:hypothetical protein [Rhizomicrobium sp.]
MYLDETGAFGGGWSGPCCLSCKLPILDGERSARVEFRSDPLGAKGLTGEYHLACSKPFASLARVLDMDGRGLL